MALNRLEQDFHHDENETKEAVNSIESEMEVTNSLHAEPDASRSTLNLMKSSTFDNNNNIDTDDSYNDDDFYDDVNDPDWTLKRKREDNSACSDSESDSAGSHTETRELNAQTYQTLCIESNIEGAIGVESEENVREASFPDIIERVEEVETTVNENDPELGKSGFEKNKLLRMQGKKYFGFKKGGDGKSKYCDERPEKSMHPKNCTKRCDKGWGGRQCSKIDEHARGEIFNMFWKNMNWREKKVYDLSLVAKIDVARRTTGENSRRKFSYSYYLRVDDQRYAVCKSLFLATLALKEDTVYNWINENESEHGIPGNSQKETPGKNTKTEAKDSATKFLQEIPKMPLHYCRARTSKLYLETELASNQRRQKKVITMDLQSLLLCPKLEASCLFYKTKLCCHNFTLFDLSTKAVMNYFWNETAADLSSSTFATCIIDYMETLDLNGIEKVILYSDGCTYQNRNIILSCALLRFADYSKLLYYTGIRPGHGVGTPVATDIRVLKYTVDGNILYKLNYSDREFCELRKPRNASHSFTEYVPAAYVKPLVLKKSKYQHLQQIKEVIPKDYHAYYDQLPHAES
ncbi:hypothetical protein MAR_015188 [Mya arenaria]|uniref:Uncharacterized protein n=1 Tax=Mya arenaria TaxID=6604 RepID=A0ABY7FK21_MYAAR|nr:hypothetical protein MAR_015188 [Mya arenaria]